MIRMKLIFFLCCMAILSVVRAATITYTVTKTIMNNTSGSLQYILTNLTSNAVIDANAGNNVIIYFDAPGLVQMSIQFINISSSTGTLSCQKHPTTTVTQGFERLSGTTGMDLVNSNSGTKIEFLNLEFKSFTYAVWSNPTRNLVFQNCHFEDCIEGIHLGAAIAFTVNSCSFSESSANVVAQSCGIHIYASSKGQITNNDFSANATSSNSNLGIAITGCGPSTITCTSNTFTNNKDGIYYANEQLGYASSDYSYNFSSNVFNNNLNHFHFSNPFPGTVIDYNTLSNTRANDFLIDNVATVCFTTGAGPGLDFISNNSLGLSVFNNSNIFNGSGSSVYQSFKIANSSGFGSLVNIGLVRIIGLDLPGRITVESGKTVLIRETKIASNIANLPIDLMGFSYSMGNTGIDPPSISSVSFAGSSITVNYFLTGNMHNVSPPFAVEVFKCNSNGDLIEFIDRQIVNSVTASMQTFNPALLTPMQVGDFIAITVSSSYGTSEVVYPTIACGQILSTPISCLNTSIPFITGMCSGSPILYTWNFGDGTQTSGSFVYHSYSSGGLYAVTLTIDFSGLPSISATSYITIANCYAPNSCSNCIGSFAPDPGDYVLSLWVKEDSIPVPISYTTPKINISFTGDPTAYTFGTDNTKNKIIDGWQRIEESFSVPLNATHLNLELINLAGSGGTDAYFDDIRIIPKDGQMKSYVYDPVTLRLSAILDENNYATFYEYDEEGKLLRIKKETERGIMTVQENRESSKKK